MPGLGEAESSRASTGGRAEPLLTTGSRIFGLNHWRSMAPARTCTRGSNSYANYGGNYSSGAFDYSIAGTSFYTLFPCRLIDTRNPAGPRGGPSLTGGASRTFVVINQCSLPATATAIAVNVTETGAQGSGNLRVYPGGTSVPNTSTMNFSVGQTRANNAIVLLGASGDISVFAGIGSGLHVDFILDIVGYFAP